jgi:hypothetical protein
MLILNVIYLYFQMYMWLAEYLTELELIRTQTEFDDSLTLKIYLLQFVNYYASIFYIAFFKGKFIGRPGEYKRFMRFRQEEVYMNEVYLILFYYGERKPSESNVIHEFYYVVSRFSPGCIIFPHIPWLKELNKCTQLIWCFRSNTSYWNTTAMLNSIYARAPV